MARTQTEREAVIETARTLDGEAFDTHAHVASPGKYECAQDLPLVVALDIINDHGLAGESAGEVAMTSYAWRFGRFVAIEDAQGFVDVEVHPTEGHAADRLRDFTVSSEDEES